MLAYDEDCRDLLAVAGASVHMLEIPVLKEIFRLFSCLYFVSTILLARPPAACICYQVSQLHGLTPFTCFRTLWQACNSDLSAEAYWPAQVHSAGGLLDAVHVPMQACQVDAVSTALQLHVT